MAEGDYAFLKKFRDPIACISAWAGTTCYVLEKSGQLNSYTIADGASAPVSYIAGNVKCMYSDNTTIWFGMGDGRLIKYTISTKADSELKRFDAAVININMLSNVLYVGTADGRLHTVATA